MAGCERLQPAAVIAASGLRHEQVVSRKDLDAAAQKLFETGFFTSVNYRYDPKPASSAMGYAVTFQVSEELARLEVMLDFPSLDAGRLWDDLRSADGLLEKRMPDNERAWRITRARSKAAGRC